MTLVFRSPGTPVISSNGGRDAIAWIVEPNVGRLDNLVTAPPATLHAVDVMRMQALWSSKPEISSPAPSTTTRWSPGGSSSWPLTG